MPQQPHTQLSSRKIPTLGQRGARNRQRPLAHCWRRASSAPGRSNQSGRQRSPALAQAAFAYNAAAGPLSRRENPRKAGPASRRWLSPALASQSAPRRRLGRLAPAALTAGRRRPVRALLSPTEHANTPAETAPTNRPPVSSAPAAGCAQKLPAALCALVSRASAVARNFLAGGGRIPRLAPSRDSAARRSK